MAPSRILFPQMPNYQNQKSENPSTMRDEKPQLDLRQPWQPCDAHEELRILHVEASLESGQGVHDQQGLSWDQQSSFDKAAQQILQSYTATRGCSPCNQIRTTMLIDEGRLCGVQRVSRLLNSSTSPCQQVQAACAGSVPALHQYCPLGVITVLLRGLLGMLVLARPIITTCP